MVWTNNILWILAYMTFLYFCKVKFKIGALNQNCIKSKSMLTNNAFITVSIYFLSMDIVLANAYVLHRFLLSQCFAITYLLYQCFYLIENWIYFVILPPQLWFLKPCIKQWKIKILPKKCMTFADVYLWSYLCGHVDSIYVLHYIYE